MRVKTWVEVEQEVEVEVSIADVMSSITALAESDRLPMTLDCINQVHTVLREIPDARIAEMNDKQRRIFCDALRAQADRYLTPDDNWANLLKKYDPLIGNKYFDEEGNEHIFIGLLHGQDDYYFVMWREGKVRLLTCVGVPEQMGFQPYNDKA